MSRCFDGEQRTYAHRSPTLGCDMRFAAFVPPGKGPFPALLWLSGLTCTEENFSIKAGAQRAAARLGVVLLIPDTSPRGPDVPGDPDGGWDFGLGAGFYVDATEAPYAAHYKMRSYIEREFLELAATTLPFDRERVSISGHSMGGHGALTIALRNPKRFKSVSAFAPISSPINCPWGLKALDRYLGPDLSKWRAYDSCALLEDGAKVKEILVDQGAADPWLDQQLKPDLLEAAARRAGVPLMMRRRDGYDHGYFFVSTFIDEHLAWHRERLG
ncbi:MAG: S-formylglutathione hydrolase [Parvularculaceae bacterium]|nr:S-formylglutathione hydrolase [Parvularculaceae bacterium]